MIKNYQNLTEAVRNRINPDQITLRKAFTDELSAISYSDVLLYIRYAMKGVDLEYTQKSKEAGERVKGHLRDLTDVSFEYQGSVMTNTHIKGHSDIDLLVISEKFYFRDLAGARNYLNEPSLNTKLNAGQVNNLLAEVTGPAYTGNSLVDLRGLRLDSENILKGEYYQCDVSMPKAIKITNQSLKRDVDIVISNWYDDVTSIIHEKGLYRGIQIYNKELDMREPADYPFLSIARINHRSSDTGGRLKKMIRFLKNLKADSGKADQLKLSSFDFNAICYDIDPHKYYYASFIELVPILYAQLSSICNNSLHADRIISVDGREPIFKGKPEKVENLRAILAEVESIFMDLRSAA